MHNAPVPQSKGDPDPDLDGEREWVAVDGNDGEEWVSRWVDWGSRIFGATLFLHAGFLAHILLLLSKCEAFSTRYNLGLVLVLGVAAAGFLHYRKSRTAFWLYACVFALACHLGWSASAISWFLGHILYFFLPLLKVMDEDFRPLLDNAIALVVSFSLWLGLRRQARIDARLGRF